MNREVDEAAAIIELESPKQTSFTPYTLSKEQIQAIQNYGYPDSFGILFYRQRDASNQVQDMRLETWIILDDDIELTFNGTLTETEAIENSHRPYHSANYTANFFDVWIQLTSDGLAWEIGGSITIDLHVDDELRSWYDPNDSMAVGYWVWFPNTVDETFPIPVEGLIYEEMESDAMKMEMLIGKTSTDKPDYSFMMENLEIALPEDFPIS